jgi:hypothetical protein
VKNFQKHCCLIYNAVMIGIRGLIGCAFFLGTPVASDPPAPSGELPVRKVPNIGASAEFYFGPDSQTIIGNAKREGDDGYRGLYSEDRWHGHPRSLQNADS